MNWGLLLDRRQSCGDLLFALLAEASGVHGRIVSFGVDELPQTEFPA
jgi:hypothetical protein